LRSKLPQEHQVFAMVRQAQDTLNKKADTPLDNSLTPHLTLGTMDSATEPARWNRAQ